MQLELTLTGALDGGEQGSLEGNVFRSGFRIPVSRLLRAVGRHGTGDIDLSLSLKGDRMSGMGEFVKAG